MPPDLAAQPSGRYAARCAYLQTRLSDREPGQLTNTCLHPARDGRPCVGPFLDDMETDCGLWELTREARQRTPP